MRYLFGFLCVCALSVVPLAGCSETQPECEKAADCDDQNDCTDEYCSSDGTCHRTTYDGALCDDDGNECMYGACVDGACTTPDPADSYYWVEDETPCESDGVPGICLCGVCGEDPCEDDCDGNDCTESFCDPCSGSCYTVWEWNDCEPCDRNGVPGVCIEGICEEDPCFGLVCDDDNECTEDSCDSCNGGCQNTSRPYDCRPCDWNGAPGVCVSGACGENLCEGVACDDGNLCTHGECDCRDGTCGFMPVSCSDGNSCTEDSCDPDTGCNHTAYPDGTSCGCLGWGPCDDPICWIIWCPPCCTHSGYCQNGECV
jgi:hypothetical protein